MPELRRMRPLLGTYVELGVCAPQGTVAERALTAAFGSLERSQALWSFQSPDSELSALNRRPGEAVRLSAATLRLLRLALLMTRASAAAFDCTVGGELVRRGVLPDHGPGRPLPRGDAADVQLGAGWARLRRPVRLTLDGIAKGFAVDLAVSALGRCGATGGWVNAGGDLRVFGDRVLPVQRREADGRLAALGSLRDAALASSRAGGPADPAFPACIVGSRGDAEVVSVVARRAWRADALTKVAASLAPPQRAEAVARLGGCLVAPTAWKAAA